MSILERGFEVAKAKTLKYSVFQHTGLSSASPLLGQISSTW